jgi:hypothetical protein
MQPDFILSPEEAALVTNSSWLITKQRIVGKVYGLFGMLSEKFGEIISGYGEYIDQEVLSIPPKIYKGEMYRQLPYVMLDHPRYFSQDDVFAIRNMFWWGNHFSIHLMLSGKYRDQFEPRLRSHINEGTLDQWYLGINEDPWEHHFEDDNYMPIHILRNHPQELPKPTYLKIARLHPLEQWKDTYSFYISSYSQLLECLV